MTYKGYYINMTNSLFLQVETLDGVFLNEVANIRHAKEYIDTLKG